MEHFLSKNWCNQVFRLSYPLLKKIDNTIPIEQQLYYDNHKYNRYYKKPLIYQYGERYLLCSQWYEYQRASLERWINKVSLEKEPPKILKEFLNNTDDFRFSKDSYVKKDEPILNYLRESIGTPVHISYLKMSEDDSRRHKSRCVEYDKKKNVCMCEKSPYFTMRCGGSSHCVHYAEKKDKSLISKKETHVPKKKVIEIISIVTQRKKKCPHCQERIESRMIDIDYSDNGRVVSNKLPVYECTRCDTIFILDSLFRSYTRKKDIENISVSFKEN